MSSRTTTDVTAYGIPSGIYDDNNNNGNSNKNNNIIIIIIIIMIIIITMIISLRNIHAKISAGRHSVIFCIGNNLCI